MKEKFLTDLKEKRREKNNFYKLKKLEKKKNYFRKIRAKKVCYKMDQQ